MVPHIRHAAVVILLGFLILSVGVTYWQVVRGDDLDDRGGNPRIAELSAREDRGTIWSADGVALVRSEPDSGGRPRRVHALPSLAHTLGYVSARFGVSGLEEAFNAELSGRRSGGAAEQAWHEFTRERARGNDVVTTIDARVQRVAAEELGDRPGAVVALDPRTGAVLAIVSTPGYDAARIDELGDALLRDPGGALINRVTQGLYAPGSVFKTVTAAAGLDSGEFKPNTTFRCPSGLVVGGFVIACKGVPDGVRDYDFAHAYAWSVNVNFAEIGLKIGAERLVSQSRRFGFEERIPFDLPVATSRLLRPGASFNEILLATSAFGQGELQSTPLQMALVAAAVANNGAIMQPYLVSHVADGDGLVLRRNQPQPWRTAIRPETASVLRGFMVTAVRDGFGQGSAIPGITVGGKTGTAESAPGELPHAWYTGIAPVENPTVAVAVIVENAGPGSTVAAPIASAVMRAALGR